MKTLLVLLATFIALAANAVDVATLQVDKTFDSVARSSTAKRHFAKEHPCPATGQAVPSCKGYVIDHVVPLCAGGADNPANMQWQSVALSRLKDRIEKASCTCVREHGTENCPNVIWAPTTRRSP